MIEELARHPCMGDDGTPLVVVEYRHIFMAGESDNVRKHRGSIWMSLLNGEPVRHIDSTTFEVVASGELLRRRSS